MSGCCEHSCVHHSLIIRLHSPSGFYCVTGSSCFNNSWVITLYITCCRSGPRSFERMRPLNRNSPTFGKLRLSFHWKNVLTFAQQFKPAWTLQWAMAKEILPCDRTTLGVYLLSFERGRPSVLLLEIYCPMYSNPITHLSDAKSPLIALHVPELRMMMLTNESSADIPYWNQWTLCTE